MNELVFGITGHRKLLDLHRLENLIQDALNILSAEYTFHSIVSPLAEGADRMVANKLIYDYYCKLITPLPFERTEYEKDFSADSKVEFESYLTISSSIYEVSSLKDHSREECYFRVGEEVLNKCDILIALWDGKASKGLGGTGDIVAYALKIKKPILHIHTTLFKVHKINFTRFTNALDNKNHSNNDS